MSLQVHACKPLLTVATDPVAELQGDLQGHQLQLQK